MNTTKKMMNNALANNLLSQVHDLKILTDIIDYPGVDQVFPMYPEQPFFLDELDLKKLQSAEVLEIGLGSGVLSIGALKAGAKHVTALEINPRAKLYAGFNALINGVSGGLSILDGNRDDIWAPVRGRTFDYIISNPPFMPTPTGGGHYFHSGGGGILGLDFLDKIFQGMDAHLSAHGHAQIVTAAPGDAELPTELIKLAKKHLSGSVQIVIDPLRISFEILAQHLPADLPPEDIISINRLLQEQGITHQYLCVIHYEKGLHAVETRFSEPHAAWDMPLEENHSPEF